MNIKSAAYYRRRYMIDVRHCKDNDDHNLSFIGHEYLNANGEYEKGFFDLVHGDKSDIRNFIAQHLKNAEDGQAIYEFLQNAEDAKSSSFMAFYNDDYFLAVNNGRAFTKNGIRAILNVAQSDKKDSSLIGRFGIGFKLVHRLVGEGEGLDELLLNYCGPILFSWNREDDLLSLMNTDSVNPIEDVADSSPLPYLFKILITSFPAGVGESVFDIEHKERIGFTQDEYEELSHAVGDNLRQYLGQGLLNSGSLFFIKLGKGKKEKLDSNFESELKVGVEYSLNTLSHIQNVIINGTTINKVELKIEKGRIEKGSDEFNAINPEYKESDIHFSVGYGIDFNSEHPFVASERLKTSPTFYKFFPLGDEIHSSALFIHCDALSNQTNRRKLQDDNTNRTLLPYVADFIEERLSLYEGLRDWEAFRQLYASILLTDRAHDNSSWLNTCFFDLFPAILKKHIPIIAPDGSIAYTPNAKDVKVRKIKSNIPLSVVNDNIRWFAWGEEYKELVKRAKDKTKVGLEQYDICDLINDADITRLNNWIESANDEEYESFLTELNEADEKKLESIEIKLRQIKLLKFTDGKYYARTDVVQVTKRYDKNGNPFFHRSYFKEPSIRIYVVTCLHGMETVFDSLGIIHTEKNLSDYKRIEQCIPLPDSMDLFERIAGKVSEKNLSLEEKRILLTRLADNSFSGVGHDTISKLKLCDNNKGERVALSDLVRRNYPGYTVPEWLKPYQIKEEDYFKELDGYMLKQDSIYDTIICSKWDELKVTDKTKVQSFYSEVSALYAIAKEKKSMRGLSRIFTEDGEYKLPGDVFCLQSLSDNDGISYNDLATGLKAVFGKALPKKELLPYLKKEPFRMEDKRIASLKPTNNVTTVSGIEALVDTARLNNESFFVVFSISKTEDGFVVKQAQTSCPQAYTDKEEVLKFIAANCKGCFTLLPKEFSKYSGNSGIYQHESLYRRILLSTSSSFDTLKESLIDILSYDSVKVDFLMKLKSITLNLDGSADENTFAIKVFKMATKVLESEEKRKSFRGCISFTKNGVSTPLGSIPTSASSVFSCKGAKKDFDIALLLPNEYGNGGLLKTAVEILQKEGISLQDINTLLGISDSPDQDDIYAQMKEHYKVIENTQQLAFAILKGNGSISKSGFSVYARNGKLYQGSFVVVNHSFIDETYNLDKRYSDLGEYLSLPLANDTFINDCYIKDGEFVTLSLNTSTDNVRDYVKVIDLLEFLYVLRLADKEAFKAVTWSSIKGSLGFDPTTSTFPAKYASSNEKLPDKIEEWAEHKEGVSGFFADMGMLTEDMKEISFRKYLSGIPVQYSDTDIYSCQCVKRLEESLKWLADRSVFPLSSENKECFLKAIEQINRLRDADKRAKIVITDSFDYSVLNNSSVEYSGRNYSDWSKETEIRVFLYDGALPKTISIDEYISGIAIQYIGEANVAGDKPQRIIYANKHSDLQAELHILAKENTVGLTNEMVYKLFDASIASMRAELEQYKKQLDLISFGGALMSAESPNEPGKAEQIESNEEAKKIVMERLLGEGFTFTNGIGQFASISGVIDPDGKPVKIVVKSALAGTVFIHPNEWADLLTPGAQLWLRTRNGTYPIHIREMIRQQDKINLSIDTANLDSGMGVSKIATLMQWMKAIHFKFNSIVPTHIAQDYHEYAFDNRSMDEKPTADDFPV